jgi:hypothetical protein
MDLVEFLLARLAEDEQAALAAAAPHKAAREWWVDPWYDGTGDRADIRTRLGIITSGTGGFEAVPAEHVARHDPARVLAEVEAKRRIVDAFVRHDEESSDPCESCWAQGLGEALRLLALPYADHPECHPSWLPAVKA